MQEDHFQFSIRPYLLVLLSKQMPTPPTTVAVTASYTSPTQHHQIAHPVNAPLPLSSASSPDTVKAKVLYLSKLREATKVLQEDVNAFLTGKMEEDKAKVNGAPGGGEKERVRAEREARREEERYGEEGGREEEEGGV
ncbi:MAG: hypothetical protein Q9227_001623 [Pyrenula ochraceoflavens]